MQEEEGLDGKSGGAGPIIIKKVYKGGGHHGGAWKVAFADFVTAMMALFMVLWMMNTANKEEKAAVSSYFHDPKGFAENWGASQPSMTIGQDDLNGLAEKLAEAMKEMPELDQLRDHVVATVSGEGLRIELLEDANGMFFQSGSSEPSVSGKQAIQVIAAELGKLPNKIIIEGHTDARPIHGRKDYTNWELSVGRANAARRIMAEAGLDEGRIVQVRGFADGQLRNADEPEDPSNRRITMIVRFEEGQKAAQATTAAE